MITINNNNNAIEKVDEDVYKDFRLVSNKGGFYKDDNEFQILKELIINNPDYYPNDIKKRLNELIEKDADFIIIGYSIHEFDRNKELYHILSRVVSYDREKDALNIDNNVERTLNNNITTNIININSNQSNIKQNLNDINKTIEINAVAATNQNKENQQNQNRNKITFNIDSNYIPKLSDFLPKDMLHFFPVPDMTYFYKSYEYNKLEKLITKTPNRYSKHFINRINELIEKKVKLIVIGYSIYDDKNKDLCHIESSEVSYDDKNNRIVKKTMEHFITNHITNTTIIVSHSDNEETRIIIKDENGDSLDMEQFKNINNHNKNQDMTKAIKFVKLIKEDEFWCNFNQRMNKITEHCNNINNQNKKKHEDSNQNKTIIKKKETECNKNKRTQANENKKSKDSNSNKRKRTKDVNINENKKRCKI